MSLEWETPIYNELAFNILYEPGDPFFSIQYDYFKEIIR